MDGEVDNLQRIKYLFCFDCLIRSGLSSIGHNGKLVDVKSGLLQFSYSLSGLCMARADGNDCLYF